MACGLGSILLIANPTSQNGRGSRLAEQAVEQLFTLMSDCSIEVLLTKHARHATHLAAESNGYDALIVLGGDGVVHEAVNGLMQLPKDERPAFGVIPTGSGNDFAKALGMPRSLENACAALCTAEARWSDVGWVNGRYFAETLSFGLDAAIALDTVERRKRTGRKGVFLYGESAIHQVKNNFRFYDYSLQVDGGDPHRSRSITFAVQNGPYYGGGFDICPEAKLDDGLFDVCISHPPVTRTYAALAFMRAKSGKHTGMRKIEMFRAKTLTIDFDEEPPAQTDGELLEGTHFEARVEPEAIRFLYPQRHPMQEEDCG